MLSRSTSRCTDLSLEVPLDLAVWVVPEALPGLVTSPRLPGGRDSVRMKLVTLVATVYRTEGALGAQGAPGAPGAWGVAVATA